MTTFTSTALRGWTGSLCSAAAASVMALALAGCETGSSLLANGEQTAPQTALAGQQTPPAAAVTQTARIEIAPIIGAPENVARDLQAQLGTSIERNKLTVARGPAAKGEYVLRGYVVAAREKAGSKISYIWDVTDQTGKRAHRITGEEMAAAAAGDPWSGVNAQIMQAIADKTATQIATWYSTTAGVPVAGNSAAMSPVAAANTTEPVKTAAANAASTAVATGVTPAAQTAAFTPGATPAGPTTGSIEQGAFNTIVPGVSGAPGDGGQSLTGAIQRELSKNGVPLTTTAGSAQTYKVEGKVVMGQGKDGKQPIQIDWNVYDPKGKKLGTVSQKNEVPQGSLDGTWGKTADAAAQAAAQGIVKLLPPATKTN
ncbi:MAG: hypothetical protein ABL907_13155 [Hyphomicrobium sp.]